MRLTASSLFKVTAGLFIGGLALWYFFTQFDFHGSLDVIYSASVAWLSLAIILYYSALFIKAIRWWYLLKLVVPDISLTKTYQPYLLSIIVNAFLPLRAGDILRISNFKKKLNIPIGVTTGCMVSERIIDTLVILFYLLFSLYFVPNVAIVHDLIGSLFISFVLVVVMLSLVIFVRPLQVRAFLLIAVNKISISNGKWMTRILKIILDIVNSMTSIQGYRNIFSIIGLSFVGWGLEGGLFIAVAYSLGITDFGLGAWLAFCLATIVQSLPNAPASIGLFQLSAFIGMTSFGISEFESGTFSILSHAVYFVALLLIYLLFSMFLFISKVRGFK